MTRLEMAHKKYKDGVAYTVDGNRVEIIDTCPYFLDCGEDDLDDSTVAFNKQDKVSGCRGISCEEC